MVQCSRSSIVAVLGLGLLGSTALTVTANSTGCIILGPECIIVPAPGTTICKPFENAMGTLPDETESHLILDDGTLPEGCICVTAAELELLNDGDPDDPDRVMLQATIDLDARAQCLNMALALGYETYNCETVDEVNGPNQERGPGSCNDGCALAGDCTKAQENACELTPYGDTDSPPGAMTDGDGSGADETSTDTSELCAGWDPASVITARPDVTIIDAYAFADLLHDPTPFIACDSARIIQAGSTATFTGVTTGTAAQLLGLHNGDIPLSLNGLPLSTFQDFYTALTQLPSTTNFSLAVKRGNATVSLDYTIR